MELLLLEDLFYEMHHKGVVVDAIRLLLQAILNMNKGVGLYFHIPQLNCQASIEETPMLLMTAQSN